MKTEEKGNLEKEEKGAQEVSSHKDTINTTQEQTSKSQNALSPPSNTPQTHVKKEEQPTSQKEEEQIAIGEKQFKILVENLPDKVILYDKECRAIYVSPQMDKVFGKDTASMLLNKTPLEAHQNHYFDAEPIQQKLERVIATGEKEYLDHELLLSTGEKRYGQIRFIAQKDENGEVCGAMSIITDITEEKIAALALHESEELYRNNSNLLRSVMESSAKVTIFALDREYKYLTFNELHKKFYKNKYGIDIGLGKSFIELVPDKEFAKGAKNSYDRALSGEYFTIVTEEVINKEDYFYIEYWNNYISPIYNDNKNITGLTVISINITEQREAEMKLELLNATLEEKVKERTAKLQQALDFNKGIMNAIPDLMFEVDREGTYLNVWAKSEELLAAQKEILLGNKISDILSEESTKVAMEAIEEADKNGLSFGKTLKIDLQDGAHWFELSSSKKEDGNIIFISRDITQRKISQMKIEELHKALEQKVKWIQFMAHHDILTGLPNRLLLQDRAEQILAKSKRDNVKAAFLFIDLDGFKTINDSLGHSVGDVVLKEVAQRLQSCTRASDTLGRQGGDEFILIAPGIQTFRDIELIVKKLTGVFKRSFIANNQTLSVTASIGITLYPDHGESFEQLLQNADTAMYKAKETGKNTYCIFTQEMQHDAIGLLKMKSDLIHAIDNKEFELYYQPQIDLSKNKIIGAEALIRWNHPSVGLIPPLSFISVAEECGHIVEIGEWVVQEACHQAALWHDDGKDFIVAVNISAVQFKRGDLAEIVKKALDMSKLNPKYLELELTESILICDTENILKTLRTIKEFGVQLSIDDFGTGYSSLSYLKRFAVDKLKIDQSFIRDILKDKDDATIVKTIINIANSFNLKSIAEGVESKEVLELIREFGCDEVQGYYFAKPMKAEEFRIYYKKFNQ
ncbi:MAG: EAL domain-containing protein [Campylobacterales bacterium]|nr:EAL domain-containing protein [Campylobacterales bacterium]